MVFKKYPHLSFLILLAIVFFFVYSYLPLTTPQLFNSPDETANFVFIKQYKETGQLRVNEPLNQEVGNIIHPRSVNVTLEGDLVPGSFLGLILIYGWLAKVFGVWLVKFLTPLFSVIAIFCFYGLLKRVFNEKIAFLSAILMFINPAFWYYATRGLMPNVLLIDLIIIGFYFLILNKHWSYALAGVFLGLALLVRMIEGLWLVPLLFVLLILFIKKFKKEQWLSLALFILFLAIALLPAFIYQQSTYGNWSKVGYNRLEVIQSNQGGQTFEVIRNLFPFGFHPKLAIKNFFNYYIKFFWWLFIPALGGWLLLLKQHKKLSFKQKIFVWLSALVSVFLVVYYGSGYFTDNPTPWRVTIGNSYVRYWLPMYIFSLPFLALFLTKLKEIIPKINKIVLPLSLLIIVYFSFSAVLWRDEENVLAIKDNINKYAVRKEITRNLTEDNSIIIVQRGDKLFFPTRKVIVLNDLLVKLEVLPVLAGQTSLYGYFAFSEQDLEDFSVILASLDFNISKAYDFETNEDLYRINKKEE